MAFQFPNITGQYGIYLLGTASIDVANTHGAIDGKIKFSTRAVSDSWSDGDLVGIRVSTSAGSKVLICAWDSSASTLTTATTEESVGTIGDNEVVIVEAVFTKAALQAALDTVSYNFTPKGGVFVPVTEITFRILEEHNGKTLCVPDTIVDPMRFDLFPDLSNTFQCSIIAETDLAVQVQPQSGATLNGAFSIVVLPGQFTGAYIYCRSAGTFVMVS
jgi:hypothetical protein